MSLMTNQSKLCALWPKPVADVTDISIRFLRGWIAENAVVKTCYIVWHSDFSTVIDDCVCSGSVDSTC